MQHSSDMQTIVNENYGNLNIIEQWLYIIDFQFNNFQVTRIYFCKIL